MSQYPVKQVILMRTDLRNTQGQKVRSGKLMAQAAHAAMIFITRRLCWDLDRGAPGDYRADGDFSPDEMEWMRGSFAKIVLAVGSENELRDLVRKADKATIEACICTDNGTTEFGGVPTVTCAAIGPAASDVIDGITGHLKPL